MILPIFLQPRGVATLVSFPVVRNRIRIRFDRSNSHVMVKKLQGPTLARLSIVEEMSTNPIALGRCGHRRYLYDQGTQKKITGGNDGDAARP